jgi:predicted dehydrogenase
MSDPKLGVGIVGCGNIADRYAQYLLSYPQTNLIGVTDVISEKAETLAAETGCQAYPSLEAMLADESIELVVNLTVHHAHKEITTQCLEAGKHVYSEKPLALTYEDAKGLVELAKARGLRLGCSPFTYMGEAQQTAWKLIRAGKLGKIRLAYAEVNWGRIEIWHPAPLPFYNVGVLFDVGVYPLTLLTTFFGPARRVSAFGKVIHPNRVTKEGDPFTITTPDFMVTLLELENGPLVRLTTDFYVSRRSSKQDGVEFHGDIGTLYLGSWHDFNVPVEYADFNQPFKPVPLLKEPYPQGVEWGRGVQDMALAIAEGRPHRATGEQAAHVVEIMCAITQAIETRQPVEIHSSFTPPAPMDWA